MEPIKNALAHHDAVIAVVERQIARRGAAADALREPLRATLADLRAIRREAETLAANGRPDAARERLARAYRGN